jgi:hypothetical protein
MPMPKETEQFVRMETDTESSALEDNAFQQTVKETFHLVMPRARNLGKQQLPLREAVTVIIWTSSKSIAPRALANAREPTTEIACTTSPRAKPIAKKHLWS